MEKGRSLMPRIKLPHGFYWCKVCGRSHKEDSDKGRDHKDFKGLPPMKGFEQVNWEKAKEGR